MTPELEIDRDGLGGRIAGLPGFEAVREAAAGRRGLPGRGRGARRPARARAGRPRRGRRRRPPGARPGARRRAPRARSVRHRDGHGRPGRTVDVARARAESYPYPGALPEVRPAGIDEDLSRRDFSVNAMAVALSAPGELIDPHGGQEDLRRGLLRALHERSLADDPTRALRAARYAARLGLEPEPGTLDQIRAADLNSVSADRIEAERRRLAAEPEPGRGVRAARSLGPDPAGPGGAAAHRRDRRARATGAVAGRGPGPRRRDPRRGRRRRRAAERGRRAPSREALGGRSRRRRGSRRRSCSSRAPWARTGSTPTSPWIATGASRSRGRTSSTPASSPGRRSAGGLDEAVRALLDGEAASREDQLETALRAARQTAP